MLHQFTWQQFLIAASVLTLIWYAGIILIFYRKELKAFIGRKKIKEGAHEPLPHRWDNEVIEENDLEHDLMGKPRLPEGMSTVSTGSVTFSGNDPKEDQVGLVPDVLEEIKSVFGILAKEDGNKQDFFSLMKLIREKYPRIGSNPNIGRINEFIIDHAPFLLKPDELEDLWD